jgi:hypothetical protein
MCSGADYAETIKNLYDGIHPDVAALLDPAQQKRRFPKKTLETFLTKKKVKKLLPENIPGAITNLVTSTEKLNLVPSELLRQFLTEHEAWDLLPDNLKKAIEGTQDPRAPTQGSSDFVINRELGDWAETVVLRAVNRTHLGITAVHYGRRDKLIAGEKSFDELYLEHMEELKALGKRPDILLYRANEAPRDRLEGTKAADLVELARGAIAGFEVRSSQQAITEDRPPEKLSFTPKVEDIDNVVRWIEHHGVPHFYVQVLFGRVYAIGFDAILQVLASSPKSEAYRIAKVARNQFKSTIYIPLDKGTCLSTAFTQPTELRASIKHLPTGRVIVIVEFAGGEVTLNEASLAQLIGFPAPANPR